MRTLLSMLAAAWPDLLRGCAGKYGNDKGSTLEPLPTDDQLLAWAREKLSM